MYSPTTMHLYVLNPHSLKHQLRKCTNLHFAGSVNEGMAKLGAHKLVALYPVHYN